jgi:hypothetical protein
MLIQNVSGELVDTIGESITTFVSGSAADIMAAEINFSGATVDTLNTLSGGNLFSVGVALSGKHVPHFKPGKDLRERVNESAGSPIRD